MTESSDLYEEVFIARPKWFVALSKLPKERVFSLATRLAESYLVRPLTASQGGLALLPLRESVQHQTFYLGEIPLSTSHLQLQAPDGTLVQGGAQIMADDADYADALAICDGVLAHRLPGWSEVADMVAEGLTLLQEEARVRKAMVARSRVHFSLLNQDDDIPV